MTIMPNYGPDFSVIDEGLVLVSNQSKLCRQDEERGCLLSATTVSVSTTNDVNGTINADWFGKNAQTENS